MVSLQDREQVAGESHSSTGVEISFISGLEKGARRGNSRFTNDIELQSNAGAMMGNSEGPCKTEYLSNRR